MTLSRYEQAQRSAAALLGKTIAGDHQAITDLYELLVRQRKHEVVAEAQRPGGVR